MTTYVHIIDDDVARRARIARHLYKNKIHAEIYESAEEVASSPPTRGAVLLSDDMREAAAYDVLAVVQRADVYLPVALFSSDPTPKRIVQGMSRGALDYLAWPCSPVELIETVERIAELGARKAKAEMLKAEARRLVETLTKRECEVLVHLIAGASNKGIAQELGLSPRTVEIHRGNLMARLDAQSVADAVRIGIYAGLDG